MKPAKGDNASSKNDPAKREPEEDERPVHGQSPRLLDSQGAAHSGAVPILPHAHTHARTYAPSGALNQLSLRNATSNIHIHVHTQPTWNFLVRTADLQPLALPYDIAARRRQNDSKHTSKFTFF